MKYIIAYDLGTGGMKASLFDQEGKSIAAAFAECETLYPQDEFREQRPSDWMDMLETTTKALLAKAGVDKEDIVAAGCSGHSLGVVPIGKDGSLLLEQVPIWSDARADKEEAEIFAKVDEVDWYLKTGNGFPGRLYSSFKIRWYQKHMPEMYNNTQTFIGTKDYINYCLTGRLCTDHSYASGSGVYDLEGRCYDSGLIEAMGLQAKDFPEVLESAQVVGTILPAMAEKLGLSDKLVVSAGGVDNACMAAGAGCVTEGSAYTSLGTSAWIAICSNNTRVDAKERPYTFAHLIPGMYIPAQSIFSAGNTFRWVRDVLCPDFVQAQANGGKNAYDAMTELASTSPVGANGVYMTPHLAGGNALDKSLAIRGSFTGLDLKHSRADLIRASLEGICMNLRVCLDALERDGKLSDDMQIVGGGAKSAFWRGLFADIYHKNILLSSVGEDAGSLGAMATAAIAAGLWADYSPLVALNKPIQLTKVNPEQAEQYEGLLKTFAGIADHMSDVADL